MTMNQETWNTLSTRIAERDQLQQRLEQVRTEIDQLASSLEQEIAQLRQQPQTEGQPQP